MDLTASPARDFYRYAAGQWVDTHPIPADKVRWSAFDELLERNFTLLRGLLEGAARGGRRKGKSPTPREQVGDYYAAAMAYDLRARRGYRPVEPDLRRINAARGIGPLLSAVARFHAVGVPGLFSTYVAPDEKNSSVYAFYLLQGGLSLPDRDYYLLDRFAEIRESYRTHVGRTLALAGEKKPERAEGGAQTVLRLETELAKASRTRVDLRDPERNYNRFTAAELVRRYPRLQFKEYLRARGVRVPDYVVVGQPEFFDALAGLLGSASLSEWKTYVRWHLLHDSARHLAPALEDENFDFFHRTLLGQEKPEPEWKRAAIQVDGALGEALGALYVRRYFPPAARARAAELVQDLEDVFRARLQSIPWMTPATREMALTKFGRFVTKIGHPKKFRDYRTVRISRTDPLGNFRRARAFEVRRKVVQVGKPVDRDEWQMTPPTVNAYFDPTLNEIVFPAGILQPPFFDTEMDDAVNLGGIGVVIGHEITHGYDDQGRKYDADGNLKDWWAAQDAKEFTDRAKRIVDEYSKFEPLPGLPLNGELTMGENIADLGGVSIAFEALQRRLASGRTSDAKIDGFTPEQRFFLSYGQIWRGNVRDEEQRRRISIDPHSPGRFRVNGALANVPEFWRAFSVPVGSPMRQDDHLRVNIW